jgi:glycine/serine hydroxymethyltransferase
MTNKYAEGYPGKRYYGGCEFVDVAETLAIERAKKLFGCQFANVQPNSGSQMNQAVFLALLNPGDAFMGLDLAAGGHLTHGSPVNMSGKWFKVAPYGVRRDTQIIDMDEVERIAREAKPKLIIAGATAYSRFWDFKRFREIADGVGAYLMVDMAHFAGLVAGGVHPSPFPHAHVVTSTTHKSLRGPRGGLILMDDEEIAKRINSAVFETRGAVDACCCQAVSFGEALRPDRHMPGSRGECTRLAGTLTPGWNCFGRHGQSLILSTSGRSGWGQCFGRLVRQADLQQNGILRSGKAVRDLRYSSRHARLHDARLRRRGVPPGRPDDRGGA